MQYFGMLPQLQYMLQSPFEIIIQCSLKRHDETVLGFG